MSVAKRVASALGNAVEPQTSWSRLRTSVAGIGHCYDGVRSRKAQSLERIAKMKAKQQ
jgi:hypothetical protein